jgi:hypothetical protein
VCLLAPWAKTVVLLALEAKPARATGTSSTAGSPWGLELANGRRCVAVQGSHDTVSHREGGTVIDFSCPGGLLLLRGVDRTTPIWKIRAARARWPKPDLVIGKMNVRVAWFGGNAD